MGVSRAPYVHLGPEILLLDGPYYVVAHNRNADGERIAEVWRMLKSEHPGEAVRLHLFALNYSGKYRAKAAGGIEVSAQERQRLSGGPSGGG
jgi:hypothetical protein